jgi:DNA-binding SARP family transcriptional activator
MPRLQLLGMPSPTMAGSGHVRFGQKPLVLLARLLVEPRPVAREAMMAFLWPEASEARARGSLRQALHVVREITGPGCLTADRQSISLLHPPVADLHEFLSAIRHGDWQQAALTYGGPLLDGVALKDATDADLWLVLERRRLSRLFETAATAVLEAREPGSADGDTRLVIARRLRDVAPRSVRFWRFLLEALAKPHASDDLCFERAALGARIDTGQIDDPATASVLLEGGPLSPTTDRAPLVDADDAGDDRAAPLHGGEREIAWP